MKTLISLALTCALALGAAPARAGTAPVAAIAGRVLDAQTGLPLGGAVVAAANAARSETTDSGGAFLLAPLEPGTYVLHVSRAGYQPAVSEPVVLTSGQTATVVLTAQATFTGSALPVVGRTAVNVSTSLQRASTISRTLSAESLLQSGVDRAGDALREMPAVTNGIAGDTAALGDDLQLNIRGIGTLETLAALDGHPIAYGVPGGYNYQLSPVFPLRSTTVTYGSGSNTFGLSAIGGIVDMQTLDPTPDRRVDVSQGFGTFDKLATAVRATGTSGRIGYAVAYGVSGLDGPIKNGSFYQPGAAYDQSASDASVRALGVYRDDSSNTSRSGLAKLRYALSPSSSLTFTAVTSTYWNDKTGNGDGDYTDYPAALAFGNLLLSTYSPSTYPALPPCPPGTFVATNANGTPNGTGPNGKADGGSACQTPSQYAANNTGYDGAGPAWQSFLFDDYHLAYEDRAGAGRLRFDAFTNRYHNTIDRASALPFQSVPGDSPQAFVLDWNVAEAGGTLTDTFEGRNNDVGVGARYLNTAYGLSFATPAGSSFGAPIVSDVGLLLRDVYHPSQSSLTNYLDVNVGRSTATHRSYVDPRESLIYAFSRRDVLRVAAGATTTQPSGDALGQPFVPQPPGGAGGGAPIDCGGLNAIGSAPSSVLRPERGVDEELAYGHRFWADTQVQATAYDVHVYDKLYQTIVPLSQTGTSFIDPSYLRNVEQTVAAKCGPQAQTLLGLAGTLNVGSLRARGFLINGRIRVSPRTSVDYDWSLDSTVLTSAPAALLAANLTLVPGSQLPRLPLHELNAALDQRFGRFVDARYTLHSVSDNNTKRLPAYEYSDLRISAAAGRGAFTLTVLNLFNQYADIRGLRYQGQPLALNAFAVPASYAPYVGAAATERFDLPYRRIFLNYQLSAR